NIAGILRAPAVAMMMHCSFVADCWQQRWDLDIIARTDRKGTWKRLRLDALPVMHGAPKAQLARKRSGSRDRVILISSGERPFCGPPKGMHRFKLTKAALDLSGILDRGAVCKHGHANRPFFCCLKPVTTSDRPT